MAGRKREYEAPHVGAASARMMRALVKRAEGGELEALEELVRLQDVLQECLQAAVTGYREGPAGASWAQVAEAVGTTRQAAHARFGASMGRLVAVR